MKSMIFDVPSADSHRTKSVHRLLLCGTMTQCMARSSSSRKILNLTDNLKNTSNQFPPHNLSHPKPER